MATVVDRPADLTQEMAMVIPPHRFSTACYLEMIEKGVLGPSDRVELMEGLIVDMSPAGVPHNHFLINIVDLFAPVIGKFKLAIQGTLTVAEGQVYDPDFVLLKKRADRYRTRLPDATDALLVIEAADSSLRRDRQIKLPVYAAAGIPEYWIADLEREQFIVHREPEGSGYRVIETRRGDELVSPLAAPELTIAVRQAFD